MGFHVLSWFRVFLFEGGKCGFNALLPVKYLCTGCGKWKVACPFLFLQMLEQH